MYSLSLFYSIDNTSCLGVESHCANGIMTKSIHQLYSRPVTYIESSLLSLTLSTNVGGGGKWLDVK